jgi:thioredoxin-related protein
MRKHLWVILAFALVLSIAPSVFAQDYDSALKTAKKENKPLLLYFFNRACYYCTLMEKNTLADKEVGALLKKDFVFLQVDTDKSSDLSELYRIAGTPSSWFVESSGKALFQVPGYIQKPDYKTLLEYVKGKHYKEMDISAYLKKAKRK